MSVERLARALGVPDLVKHDIEATDAWGYITEGPDEIRIHWHDAAGPGGLESRVVDEGTALIFLLALAAGLRLDVGRCPGCDGSGEQWWSSDAPGAPWPDCKRYSWKPWPRAQWMGSRPCPDCSEPGPPVACGGFMCHDGQKPTEFDYVDGQGGERVRVITRSQACHACHGTGKKPGPPQPTGRRILGAEAILKAMPREWVQAACGRRGDDAIDYLRGIASRQGAVFMDQPEWVHGIDGQMQVRMRTPGDQPTRDALAVRADELQAEGDPLGELIAAWLAGECKVCEGSRAEQFGPLPGVNAECRGCCPPWPTKFWPTGTVLGADWPKLEALVAATCERLE